MKENQKDGEGKGDGSKEAVVNPIPPSVFDKVQKTKLSFESGGLSIVRI